MHAHALRELACAVPDVAPRHLFEIAGVLAGVRPCARVVLPLRALDVATRLMRDLGLAAGRPGVWNDVVRTHGEDRFCVRRTMSGAHDPDAAVSVIVARDSVTAHDGQRIDDSGTASECGNMLGYPRCCVDAYARIEAGADWLELLRCALPAGLVSLPFHANVVEGLFSRSALHPDFFPCALGCPHAMALVRELLDAGLSFGLEEELVEGTGRMRGRVVLLSGAAVRLHGTEGDPEVHLRPGRDPRWRHVLEQRGVEFTPTERGIVVMTPQGSLSTAGRAVHFR
jgi:hypothetical protein